MTLQQDLENLCKEMREELAWAKTEIKELRAQHNDIVEKLEAIEESHCQEIDRLKREVTRLEVENEELRKKA